MKYEVIYEKPAIKFLNKHKKEGDIFSKIFEIASYNLEEFKNFDVKDLRGKFKELSRLRVGKYRAIFEIIEKDIIIKVIEICSRGDIYK